MAVPARALKFAIWCCEQELQGRIRGERPGGVQSWLSEHLRSLQLELAVSHERHAQRDRQSRCVHEDEWISTRDAAAILGWSERTVQRRASDLEGQRLSPRKLVFRRSVVHEYSEALKHA